MVCADVCDDEFESDVVVDLSVDREEDNDDDVDVDDDDDVDVWDVLLELLLEEDDDEELRLLESLLPSPLEPLPSYKLYTLLPPHISSPYP